MEHGEVRRTPNCIAAFYVSHCHVSYQRQAARNHCGSIIDLSLVRDGGFGGGDASYSVSIKDSVMGAINDTVHISNLFTGGRLHLWAIAISGHTRNLYISGRSLA